MSKAPVPAGPALVEDPPLPLMEHLLELRRRLIVSLLLVACGAAVSFYYSGVLLSWLARPVGGLVFISPMEAFHTRMKLALYGGFFLSLPLLLHQVWLFTARALEPRWRRGLLMMAPLSYVLFMGGAAFCLTAVVPAAMRFLLSFGSEGVKPLMSLGAYVSFVTTLTLAFGAIFQFPLVLYLLDWMGILKKSQLTPRRRLVYLATFIVPAFFTPDVVGQISLALCMIALFELSLLAMAARGRAAR